MNSLGRYKVSIALVSIFSWLPFPAAPVLSRERKKKSWKTGVWLYWGKGHSLSYICTFRGQAEEGASHCLLDGWVDGSRGLRARCLHRSGGEVKVGFICVPTPHNPPPHFPNITFHTCLPTLDQLILSCEPLLKVCSIPFLYMLYLARYRGKSQGMACVTLCSGRQSCIFQWGRVEQVQIWSWARHLLAGRPWPCKLGVRKFSMWLYLEV